MTATCPSPIAVVALGDPGRRDDGLGLRVMGRVRTMMGEIALARGRSVRLPRKDGFARPRAARDAGRADRTAALSATRERPADARSGPASLVLSRASHGVAPIEWIEGGTEHHRLDSVLADRLRVVLIDAVSLTGHAGEVHHWHLRCDPATGLSHVRHYNNHPEIGLAHLALWLEDELPDRGTDLIGIEPYDLSEGAGLSRPIRSRLPTICSRVAGILLRVLDEEGC